MLLRNTLFFVAIAAVAATQAPWLLDGAQQDGAPARDGQTPDLGTVRTMSVEQAAVGGAVSLKQGANGHYGGTFRINGKSIEGMIDTGATLVAFNESTARRLGISGNALDFKYQTQTANGQAAAAVVVVDRMEIGSIRVRDVQAMVLRDNALTTILIGMSFMNKLESYRVENGTLHLKK